MSKPENSALLSGACNDLCIRLLACEVQAFGDVSTDADDDQSKSLLRYAKIYRVEHFPMCEIASSI
jgi:hypothetical protein